jgi:hypothetical protein
MSTRALITGITGQDGAYLSKLLLEKGYEVYGLVRRSSTSEVNGTRLRWLGVIDNVNLFDGDLPDLGSLIRVIGDVQPREIYNLAAQSFVKSSWHLQSRRGRPRAERGRALRPRGRQGLSCARPVEGARRRRLEDAHRRARAGQWLSSWHGDEAARKAVYANRVRLKSGIGRETMRRRGERVERNFAHVLDRGGMRRAWLRGRENIHKRYLIHVAGFDLGVMMRALHGQGTLR